MSPAARREPVDPAARRRAWKEFFGAGLLATGLSALLGAGVFLLPTAMLAFATWQARGAVDPYGATWLLVGMTLLFGLLVVVLGAFGVVATVIGALGLRRGADEGSGPAT